MELTLYVPGLLLTEAIRADTLFDLEAPALSMLLGRGQRHEPPRDWLARQFGLKAPLPAASLRKVGAGGTATGTSLCLDPVHWQVGRDGISLTAVFPDNEEADELIAAVQPLLAEWGILSASSPCHWELALSRSLMLETRPLADCLGLPVDPGLPAGLDGVAWRKLIAEIQTVLHAHPVNRRRELHGALSINSLWPWGLGSLPDSVACDFDVAWSNDPVVAGLCAQAGMPCVPPPDRYLPATGAVLCQLDLLEKPARTPDALAWRSALMQLDSDWIAPAMAAIRRGELLDLQLVGSCLHEENRCVTWSLVRGNLWRFWRRPQSLTGLA